jgi:adenosylmethionine-8-amino-7-oxononanoate aminotransferase
VMHSYTYGGNPVSCAAGVATLKYIEEHHLVERAAQSGAILLARLQELKAELPYIGDVRGKGLFLGIELVRDKATNQPFPHEWQLGEKIEEQALDNGLLVLAGVEGLVDGVAGDHLELVPPYTIEEDHISMITELLQKSISEVIDQMPF